MSSIVTADWLNDNLNNPDVIILDATFKGVNKSEKSDKNKQIKNALFFDLNHFKNQESNLSNTYPKPDFFEKEIQKLGIKNHQHIVIYDENGIYSAPRVWWLFRLMGHQKVSVLNGGLPNWINKGFPTEKKTRNQKITISNYRVNFTSDLIVDYNYVKKNSLKNEALLIDARSEGRFNGTTPEPRKELPSGKIPNSINIPYQKVLENGFLKPNNTLKSIFKDVLKQDKKLIFSCGSGITACINLLASEQILPNKKAVFDGSWTEWIKKSTTL